jgi:hypothetical protein
MLAFLGPAGADSAPEWVLKGIEAWKGSLTEEDSEKAVRCFESAVAKEPHYIPARVWLGVAYMESARWQERRDKAIEQLEKAFNIPDPQNRYAAFRQTARERLLRLRGRPKTIGLCMEQVLSTKYRDARDARQRLLDALGPTLGKEGYQVIGADVVGYQKGRSETELYIAGRKAHAGWIALIEMRELGTPGWVPLPDPGYWTIPTAEVQIALLDCELDRKLPMFTALNVNHFDRVKSSEEAVRAALVGCSDRAAKKILQVVTAEDALVTEEAGVRSVPTSIPMVFAEASGVDWGKARDLPVIVAPDARNVSTSMNSEEVGTVLLSVSRTIRQCLINDGRFAVVSQSQLNKVSDVPADLSRPDGWAQFARRVGRNCRAVLLTRLTQCEVKMEKKGIFGLDKNLRATVEIEAMVIRADGEAPSVIKHQGSKAKPYRITDPAWGEDRQEEAHLLLVEAAKEAATQICASAQGRL